MKARDERAFLYFKAYNYLLNQTIVFPFSIKFSRRLKHNIALSDTNTILNYIEDFIAERTGEDITIQENRLTFSSTYFKMRWSTNIMAPIEKGEFKLINDERGSKLTYTFFMYRLFIGIAILSVFMAAVSKEFRIGVLCFAWLGGMNWAIAIIRHFNMLDDIVYGIAPWTRTNLDQHHRYHSPSIQII